jgi:hypothetical protein
MNTADKLAQALRALTATARTFRNVPKKDQEWTPSDDDALNAAFSALRLYDTDRSQPDDAATIAAYVAMLDRLERTTQDPKTRELARRVQGNVWKLAAMT